MEEGLNIYTEIYNNAISKTLNEFIEWCYLNNFTNFWFENNGRNKGKDIVSFNDCKKTWNDTATIFFRWLPSKNIVDKKKNFDHTIRYSFTSSTCIFGVQCSICDQTIDKAYIGIYDKDVEEYNEIHNTSFELFKIREILRQKAYDNLAFWTDEDWILCNRCVEKNKEYAYYNITRCFKFKGDLIRSKSRFAPKEDDFDKTTDSLFRK